MTAVVQHQVIPVKPLTIRHFRTITIGVLTDLYWHASTSTVLRQRASYLPVRSSHDAVCSHLPLTSFLDTRATAAMLRVDPDKATGGRYVSPLSRQIGVHPRDPCNCHSSIYDYVWSVTDAKIPLGPLQRSAPMTR